MSLIADALKAAQQERDQSAEADRGRASRAQVIIDSAPPGSSRLSMPRPGRDGGRGLVYVGIIMVALAAAAILALTRGRDTVANATEAIDRVAAGLESPPDGGSPFAGAGMEELAGRGAEPYPEALAAAPAADAPDRTGDPRRAGEPAFADRSTASDRGDGWLSAAEADLGEVPPAGYRSSVENRSGTEARVRPEAPTPSIVRAPSPAVDRSGGFRIAVDRPREDEAAALFTQALNSQRLGQHDAALTLYRRAADLDDGDAELFNNMGASYRALGELENARDAYRRALALDPRYAAAWSNLGVVLDALGQRVEARSAFQEALRLEPGNTGARINLANQYHASGMLSEARRLLELAVSDDPLLPEGQYALARVLEDQTERTAAIRHYHRFLSTSNGQYAQLERQVREHLRVLEGEP